MFGPDDFSAAAGVSRETCDRLTAYVAILKDWNTRINLVSQATLDAVWDRHILDCAQIAPLVPEKTRRLADMGAGAGFPGLVLALLLEGRVSVTLFEATGKKCAFLKAAAEAMNLCVEIRNERVEASSVGPFDVVTARALAPLPKLLTYAQKIVGTNGILLFPKGESLEQELTEVQKTWRMSVVRHPSRTHEGSQILEISHLSPVLMPEKGPLAPHRGRGRRRSTGGNRP